MNAPKSCMVRSSHSIYGRRCPYALVAIGESEKCDSTWAKRSDTIQNMRGSTGGTQIRWPKRDLKAFEMPYDGLSGIAHASCSCGR